MVGFCWDCHEHLSPVMIGNLLLSCVSVSFTNTVVVFTAGMVVTTTSTSPNWPQVRDAPLPQ